MALPHRKGPKLNDITNRFSSRDCLGIESVSATISGEICPIVNTVTPRAFYWPFMCWIYYDFYKNSGIKQRDVKTFDKQFLKRQDYFFVLSNLLIENPDQYNLVGKQKTAIDINENPTGPYPFNEDYFKTRYGGMQYYNAGCLTMLFIMSEDNVLSYYNRNEESISFYQSAVKMGKDLFYKSIPCSAISYSHLAAVFAELGRSELAVANYKKAIEISEKILGEHHFYTASLYRALGLHYYNMEEDKLAEEYINKFNGVEQNYIIC